MEDKVIKWSYYRNSDGQRILKIEKQNSTHIYRFWNYKKMKDFARENCQGVLV